MTYEKRYRKEVTNMLISSNLNKTWKIVRTHFLTDDWRSKRGALLQHKKDCGKFATIDGLDISKLT